MQFQKWQKMERANRRRSVFLTILFHAILIGAITYGSSGGKLKNLMPDFVKDLFQTEIPSDDQAKA
ncbi:MAG: hypothetical protein KDC34_00285 [Saprospiraceae bacterium]|nr:hypothetical protein [Saprospiraceae bacterium]